MEKTRSGGAYIPPARLALMQKTVPQDPSSEAYQRVTWDALKKSLHGLVNKVNVSNLKSVVVDLFKLNLIRGRGLLSRSLLKAQYSSLPFTSVYAALVAVLNSKLPLVGEFILKRLILQFRKSFRRNDKLQCLGTTTFIAHLVNQGVAHEILALEMLALFLENPTDDSVEIAIGFIRECGAKLQDISPTSFNSIFERLRHILHEGQIDKRVQYMIEVLFHVRKINFADNPSIKDELDLIDEEDRVTHLLTLDDELDPQEHLFVFKYDPNYEENENKYKRIKVDILGESDDDDDDEGEDEDSDDEGDDENEEEDAEEAEAKMEIQDRTSTNLVNLRKTIYLAIMSSLDFEECAHKLLKMKISEGQEIELCNMVIECCSQERTFSKFYGLLAERFCKLARGGRMWAEKFQIAWKETYDSIHRYETNRIRNIAKLFAFLLAEDGISWSVFADVRLNEDDTTSASRIFLKIVFKELCEIMGLVKLKERFADPFMQDHFSGIFPKDNLRDTRFAINYFTSIELGGLTDDLRSFLKESQLMKARQAESEVEDIEMRERSMSPPRRSPSPRRSPPPRRDMSLQRSPSPRVSPRSRRSPSPNRSRRSPSSKRSLESPILISDEKRRKRHDSPLSSDSSASSPRLTRRRGRSRSR